VNVERAAGTLLILLPLAFKAFLFLLARRFDYPDILRSPTEDILSRPHQLGDPRTWIPATGAAMGIGLLAGPR
jgi:hypothetical protein